MLPFLSAGSPLRGKIGDDSDGIEDARNPSLGHLDAPEGLGSEGTKVITRSSRRRRIRDRGRYECAARAMFPHAWRIQLANRAGLYCPIVLTTLDSGRVLLADEYLSCAVTMSSYFASVVTGSFGTMCTIS